MANSSKPSGLSPIKTLSGSEWTGKGNMYYIDPTDTNPYYPGDLVALSGSGDPTRGVPGITLGTAGATAVGVIQSVGINADGGPYINPNDLSKTSRPTGAQSIAYYAFVLDDPNIIFEIQESGSGTNLAATAIGLNANIVYATPATGVAVSGTTMNNVGTAATSTLNLKIFGFQRRSDNVFVTSPSTGGGAQKWLVLINNHQYRTGITGL